MLQSFPHGRRAGAFLNLGKKNNILLGEQTPLPTPTSLKAAKRRNKNEWTRRRTEMAVQLKEKTKEATKPSQRTTTTTAMRVLNDDRQETLPAIAMATTALAAATRIKKASPSSQTSNHRKQVQQKCVM